MDAPPVSSIAEVIAEQRVSRASRVRPLMPSQAWTRSSSPEFVPMLGGIHARVSEDFGTMFHALLKLNGKSQKRCIRQFQMLEAAVSQCDVDCALAAWLRPSAGRW